MKRVDILTDKLRNKVLKSLYRDEINNLILIDLIRNGSSNLGELYINDTESEVTELLHIINDGNSDFTSFYFTTTEGLNIISNKIRSLNYNKILLGGNLKDVSSLLGTIKDNFNVTPNFMFKLNTSKYNRLKKKLNSELRLATIKDIEIVKEFTAKFFEAETDEEYDKVTETGKIINKIERGVYLLSYNNTTIGMARFISKTKNYAEITSVFIDEKFRRIGLGKELISHMINVAMTEGKTPVLATSISNTAAIKTYEAMGFEKESEYAFEFL